MFQTMFKLNPKHIKIAVYRRVLKSQGPMASSQKDTSACHQIPTNAKLEVYSNWESSVDDS